MLNNRAELSTSTVNPLQNQDEIKKNSILTIINKENFADHVQQIIESYYLKPMDDSPKQNLKNGYIEREIHGAMHASRATLWSLMMHNLLQPLIPDTINLSLEKIAKYLNRDIQEVLLLSLLTVTCHDAGRKGEGKDWWEHISAEIAGLYLKKMGLNDTQAQLFGNAILYKDKKEGYCQELTKLGILEEDHSAFDYIRIFVNLGDNLDLMRCVDPFQTKYIFDTLQTIKGFDMQLHEDTILQFILKIHQFIYDQHDMRFKGNIKNYRNKIIATLPVRLSNKIKVTYEHADNVFAVIFDEAMKHPHFSGLLTDFHVPPGKKYQGLPGFDPFIHGTNSSIFAMLPRTEFQVMSPLEMLQDYHVVPMSGEFVRGGYGSLGSALIKDEMIGKTSFTTLLSEGNNAYTLEKVLKDYTTLKVSDKKDSLSNFKYYLSRGLPRLFANINLILIYFIQARQSHQTIEEVISKEEIEKLQTELDLTIQFFYFIQLLGTYIHPNFDTIKESKMGRDLPDAAWSLLTSEYIMNKIKEHKIDMKEILESPTDENLHKALQVLEFPNKSTIKSGFGCVNKEVEFKVTQFFGLIANYETVKYSSYQADYAFWAMADNTESYAINSILEKLLSKKEKQKFFLQISKKAAQHIIILNERIQLFNTLLQIPQEEFILTDSQKEFLKNPFPMVLLTDAEDKIILYSNSSAEYRSIKPLKLTQDIRMIATDSEKHRLEIMNFLKSHQLENLSVILFSDLKKCKADKISPEKIEKNTYAFITAFSSQFFKSEDKSTDTSKDNNYLGACVIS